MVTIRMAAQQFLVGIEPSMPEGWTYAPEFLSPEDEQTLVGVCASLPLSEARYKGYLARRRTASFGAEYDFADNRLAAPPPIPDSLVPLRQRVAIVLDIDADALTHALVTEYRPGTELGWHRDVPNFEVVVGVSLLSSCRMRFRPYPPGTRAPALSVDLEPRSMYVLRGPARWRWQHAISRTPSLRYSITFRTRRRAGNR
jgi:alkylated DNA repair dioxygenase AlkB